MKLGYVYIWTDGSVNNNGFDNAVGGYGVYYKTLDYSRTVIEKEAFGMCPQKPCTNQIAELYAILMAFKGLNRQGLNLVIHTDSMYAINGLTQWINNWVKNNWIGSNKQPVKNKELWMELYSEYLKHNVEMVHVKGHSGIFENEKVDILANKGRNLHNSGD